MEVNYVVLLLFLFFKCSLDLVHSVPVSATLASGPFQTKIIRVEACKTLAKPVDPNPAIRFHAELYNDTTGTNLIRGTVNILRDCANKRLKVKGYAWQQGRWKSVYFMGNLGCQSTFMPLITLLTSVKYDHKNCIVFKGKYSFSGVNANKTQHTFAQVQEYGRIMWRHEFISQAGTVFCWDFETFVEPIPN